MCAAPTPRVCLCKCSTHPACVLADRRWRQVDEKHKQAIYSTFKGGGYQAQPSALLEIIPGQELDGREINSLADVQVDDIPRLK